MNSTLPIQKEEMTTEFETPRVRGFVPTAWPWVLGAVMFGVFLTTMSRWVTPFNLTELMDLANWSQNAQAFGPVTFLVTWPLRLLPSNDIPLALNLFSAFCGALALILLARSVSLLPHDRTHEQREREDSEFSILTMGMAWLPPLFAVLVCGLQLTFWENATLGTTETFNLLLFAYVVRCLLEYRISAQESWLSRFAFVYGLGMANNWIMIGLFPAFVAAVIWIKGLGAFNPRFISRTLGLGLVGLSVILLLPVMDKIAHATPLNFWQTLRATLTSDKRLIMVFAHDHRDVLGVMALTSILPVLVMGIRWSSYFGDNSPLGIFLATSMFHIVHGLIFLACLWVALDAPISPRQMGLGMPFLTFYYLSALSVGYLSGYFLLIFGVDKSRRGIHPILRALNLCVVAGVCLLLVGMPFLMVRKNLPHLQATKKATEMYEDYFKRIAQLLPSKGAVVLGDDAFWLAYLQAVLDRETGRSPHLLVDSGRLEQDPEYMNFLQRANPDYQICGPWTNIPPRSSLALAKVGLMEHLSATHGLYYMHPSFGYYFEKYYPEPHGLVYQLKPYPQGAWDAPPVPDWLIAENQAYWKKFYDEVLPGLADYMDKPAQPIPHTPWKALMDRLHLKPEPDTLALPVGYFYARNLDEWGVELQVSGKMEEASNCFDELLRLNTNSISARANKALNQALSAGKKPYIRPVKEIEKSLEQYNGSWTEVLRVDGPIDDPSFRSELGLLFEKGWNYRQAVHEFERVRTLVPNDPRVQLQLAEILIHIQTYNDGLSSLLPYTECYSKALANLDNVLKSDPDNSAGLFMKGFALMQMKSYDQAIEPLSRLIKQNTETNNYVPQLNRAIAYFKSGNYDAARSDYEAVSRIAPREYRVYYGLGEIAYQKKDKDSAIKNYELYLTNAPSGSQEAKTVSARLKELKTGAP